MGSVEVGGGAAIMRGAPGGAGESGVGCEGELTGSSVLCRVPIDPSMVHGSDPASLVSVAVIVVVAPVLDTEAVSSS